MSLAWINPQIRAETKLLKSKFKQASPFPYLVLENFFALPVAQTLLDDFPIFDEGLAKDENSNVGKKSVHQHINKLGSSYSSLDRLVRSAEFLQLVEEMTGIGPLIYDPYYYGGGTHENLHGQELDPHVDFTLHPKLKLHRRLNLILYLNKQWEEEWGGNIQFHRNPRLPENQDEIITVRPLFNRAVLFATDNTSWHGFKRINLPEQYREIFSRKSIALYFYTEEREPPVRPHSTIYVERHLPNSVQPGSPLNPEDYEEIQRLLSRRDQHLARLYNNISQLMQRVDSVKTPFSKQISANQQMVEDLNKEELVKRVIEIENSNSWRLTAPLRQARYLLNKLTNYFNS